MSSRTGFRAERLRKKRTAWQKQNTNSPSFECLRCNVGKHTIGCGVWTFEEVALLGYCVGLRSRHLLIDAIRIRINFVDFLLRHFRRRFSAFGKRQLLMDEASKMEGKSSRTSVDRELIRHKRCICNEPSGCWTGMCATPVASAAIPDVSAVIGS